MPIRNTIFANEEFYHIYNRSSFGIDIFKLASKKNLVRVTNAINYYRFPQEVRLSKYHLLTDSAKSEYDNKINSSIPLVQIYSYSIMPNHFHFIVRQNVDSGITKFISNFQNSYAKYFNKVNNRTGTVFQGPFKAKHIEDDRYLLHLSRYIHLNPVTGYQIKIQQLINYPWNSFRYYMENPTDSYFDLVETNFITRMVGTKQDYKEFVFNQEEYQKDLKRFNKFN